MNTAVNPVLCTAVERQVQSFDGTVTVPVKNGCKAILYGAGTQPYFSCWIERSIDQTQGKEASEGAEVDAIGGSAAVVGCSKLPKSWFVARVL